MCSSGAHPHGPALERAPAWRFEGGGGPWQRAGEGQGGRARRGINVMREGSSKKWGVLAGLCLRLELVLGVAGTVWSWVGSGTGTRSRGRGLGTCVSELRGAVLASPETT